MIITAKQDNLSKSNERAGITNVDKRIQVQRYLDR